ncbi:MAG: response regulator [Fulvivirga sp.]|uniref:response regulator n=1 Tax=Fulvivirga sp. TaxID=1931237 RepID=UPI0032EEF0F1
MKEYDNITILYLDDEEINLFIFEANFKNKFHVITSKSPNDALAKLDEYHEKIIVVISDMRMPVMSGLEFIRKARTKHSNIFYYILTGFDFNHEIEEALKEKVIHKFFSKPFDAKQIEEEVLEAAKKLDRL